MKTFEELLRESVDFHSGSRDGGHACPGLVLGVRLAMLGCALVKVDPDDLADRKKLIVFAEVSRCITDPIQWVTRCRFGKRTLVLVDYGKMAATFVNMDTEEAYRILARDDSRDRVGAYVSEDITDSREMQVQAYSVMPDEQLFNVTRVRVNLQEKDLPGHSKKRVTCTECGEGVNDGREIKDQEPILCRGCAHGTYYEPIDSS